MDSPVLVTIDLQHDFYHPEGTYGQHDRPLEPIQHLIRNLSSVVSRYPSVLRIQSIYRQGQFEDMPELCLPESEGAKWHPELRKGPLLTKHQHSGFRPLNEFFESPVPVVLAGVCTHRCVKATLDELIERGWTARILDDGVAACGLRQPKHERCMERWKQRGLTIEPSELFEETDQPSTPDFSQADFNADSFHSQIHSRRPM